MSFKEALEILSNSKATIVAKEKALDVWTAATDSMNDLAEDLTITEVD